MHCFHSKEDEEVGPHKSPKTVRAILLFNEQNSSIIWSTCAIKDYWIRRYSLP